MKIYTYYNEIPMDHLKSDHQKELIEIWKESWSASGFTPIVLNKQHAESHDFFQTFDSKMKKCFHNITGKQIGQYGMSCYHRWLAYATQSEERFYVSDYDVLNINFKQQRIPSGIHFYDGHCPNFASGAPHEFTDLCKLMVEVSETRIKQLQLSAHHYHDQELLFYNFSPVNNKNALELRKKYNLTFIRRPETSPFYDPILNKFFKLDKHKNINYINNNDDVTVAHIAHYNCGIINSKYPQFNNINNTRLHIMKTLNKLFNVE